MVHKSMPLEMKSDFPDFRKALLTLTISAGLFGVNPSYAATEKVTSSPLKAALQEYKAQDTGK